MLTLIYENNKTDLPNLELSVDGKKYCFTGASCSSLGIDGFPISCSVTYLLPVVTSDGQHLIHKFTIIPE